MALFILMCIAVAVGLTLVFATLFLIFRTTSFSNPMLGLAILGGFLVLLPFTPHISYKDGEISMDVAQMSGELQGFIAYIDQKLTGNVNSAKKDYTVLIFYRDAREKLATDVKNWLLSNGYNASATETDFAELPNTAGKPNTASFRYLKETGSVAPNLAQELQNKFHELSPMDEWGVDKLGRGNAQLMLF
jgi:hypothetical protein